MGDELTKGMFFALMAGVIWGVGPALLKKGMTSANVSTATLVSQYSSVLTLAALALVQREFRPQDLGWTAFWCFVAAGAVGASFGKIFLIKGIDTVGASKSVSVKNASPIITAFLGFAVLGERLTFPILVGVAFIVLGILLLTRMARQGEEAPNRLIYFMYPLMASFCFGINPIFKKIGIVQAQLPALATLVTQVSALLIMLTAGQFLGIHPRWERVPRRSFALFVLSGATEAVGSLLTFHALIYAPAVLVSPIWRISPLVTFLLARFTLKGLEIVTLRDAAAAFLIVGGVVVLGQG